MKLLQTKNRSNIFRPSFTESLDERSARLLVAQPFPSSHTVLRERRNEQHKRLLGFAGRRSSLQNKIIKALSAKALGALSFQERLCMQSIAFFERSRCGLPLLMATQAVQQRRRQWLAQQTIRLPTNVQRRLRPTSIRRISGSMRSRRKSARGSFTAPRRSVSARLSAKPDRICPVAMPRKAPTPCRHFGCRNVVTEPGFCTEHAREQTGWVSDKRRGSRHARGYGAAWVKLRELVLKRDGGLCQPCLRARRVTRATQVDHIKPKAEGGTDEESNQQSICDACHKAKTARESARARTRA